MKRIFWIVALYALVWFVAVFASAGAAHGQQRSAEQQRMLEQLPASQRQAVEEQIRRQRQQQGVRGADADEQTDRQRREREAEERRRADEGPALRPVDDEHDREARRRYFQAGDTLVLRFHAFPDVAPGLLEEERERLNEIRRRVERGNPYRLDGEGRIEIPGVARIPLAGLTEEQAVIRLRAEGRLSGLVPEVTRLPLRDTGVEALQPFGYDLFDELPGVRDAGRGFTAEPRQDIAAPADYVVGPGDVLRVQLFGNRNAEHVLTVTRDGVITFPELGPITVAGMQFDDMRAEIRERVDAQFIGTRVSVTLSELRTIRVFVLGEARRPGAYSLSSLSGITHALFAGGGVNDRGSLRDIRLMRDGERVATLDLYDLLLRGDTRNDLRVQSGDVVLIPPTGPRVSVAGDVRRPAIYELRGERTAGEVLDLAGGALSSAYLPGTRLERLDPAAGINVTSIDLDSSSGRNHDVRDGDVLRLPSGIASMEQAVALEGHVHHDGRYQWRPGMRLSDLLPNSRVLRSRADLNYVLIRREPVPNVEVQVLSADLQAAWRAPGGDGDPELQSRDTVHVFNLDGGRAHVIEPLLDELRMLNPGGEPVPVVRVGGRVRAPGEYPLEPGMSVRDLLRAGGGLHEAAYGQDAELTRYEVVNGQTREMSVRDVDISQVQAGVDAEDLLLQSHDYLNVRGVPRWRDEAAVRVEGEVVFPGTYPVDQGDTLSALIERAGGFTEHAYVRGAVFVRENLREREREQLQSLATRIERDLAAASLADPDNIEVLSVGQSLLDQIRNTEPTGRLVIDINRLMANGQAEDIVLRDGDRLMVPERPQEVTVLGEVQYATSHLHDSGMLRDDYISRSGGMTARADRQRVYVVRANGEVVAGDSSRWFARTRGVSIEPGDTIVVPMDTERVRPLVLWSSVTQIVYNLAIAAAAVNSF